MQINLPKVFWEKQVLGKFRCRHSVAKRNIVILLTMNYTEAFLLRILSICLNVSFRMKQDCRAMFPKGCFEISKNQENGISSNSLYRNLGRATMELKINLQKYFIPCILGGYNFPAVFLCPWFLFHCFSVFLPTYK